MSEMKFTPRLGVNSLLSHGKQTKFIIKNVGMVKSGLFVCLFFSQGFA